MKVKTVAEAWQKADELFPTDYVKDEDRSARAGYPQYFSTSERYHEDHINDLNDRLEVVVGGRCTNIWIEEVKEVPKSKACISRKLYRDIYLLIGSQVDDAEKALEQGINSLCNIDHLDPKNDTSVKKVIDEIKNCKKRICYFNEMLEQFENEVEEGREEILDED